MAAALQARGVGPGAHVGVLGPTSRGLVTTIQAIYLVGGTLVSLPLPMRLGSIEEFVEQTRRRIASADAALVVVDGDLAPFLEPPPEHAGVVLLDELSAEGAQAGAAAWERPPDDPDRLAILQFTSGSTAAPKGVMLPDRCVGANLDAIIAGAQLTHVDRAVSWLPLYHDMGLIGLLMAPMLHGFELVLGAPQDFLARPACWLEWISEYRGTITAGPNFSYALAARALRRADALDLSSWRLALNGAETVDPHAVESFCTAAAPFGFDARAAYPVFGMAEATLAVTFPAVGEGMTVDAVDRHALEHDRRAVAPAADASPESVRRLAVPGPTARRLRAAHRRPRYRCGARRTGSGRARAAEPVDHARLLPQRRSHGRDVRRRLAAHRRPRLPRRRRARRVRAHQGPHHRGGPQRLPGGHRARRRRRSKGCAPATSSRSAAIASADANRSWSWPRRRPTTSMRCMTRSSRRCAMP